jgi:anti-sigma factor RsiW
MNVTRNVIVDLLPVYAAGESHPDTTRLVEHWMASDAELAREAAALRDVDDTLRSRHATPPAEHELLALRRTRLALRMRSTLLGLAIFLTLYPFSFYFDGGQMHWVVLHNLGLTVSVFAVAVAAWLGWFLFAARMRVRSGV